MFLPCRPSVIRMSSAHARKVRIRAGTHALDDTFVDWHTTVGGLRRSSEAKHVRGEDGQHMHPWAGPCKNVASRPRTLKIMPSFLLDMAAAAAEARGVE